MLEPPQRAAAVVQSNPVGESGPGKRVGLDNIVQEFDQLIGPRTDLFHVVGLLDRIEVVANMVNATTGGCNDLVKPGKIAHEKALGGGAVSVEAAVCHWLTAACLVSWIVDLVAEAFE